MLSPKFCTLLDHKSFPSDLVEKWILFQKSKIQLLGCLSEGIKYVFDENSDHTSVAKIVKRFLQQQILKLLLNMGPDRSRYLNFLGCDWDSMIAFAIQRILILDKMITYFLKIKLIAINYKCPCTALFGVFRPEFDSRTEIRFSRFLTEFGRKSKKFIMDRC